MKRKKNSSEDRRRKSQKRQEEGKKDAPVQEMAENITDKIIVSTLPI